MLRRPEVAGPRERLRATFTLALTRFGVWNAQRMLDASIEIRRQTADRGFRVEEMRRAEAGLRRQLDEANHSHEAAKAAFRSAWAKPMYEGILKSK